MQILANVRWVLLLAALACAVFVVTPLIVPALTPRSQGLLGSILYAYVPLQALGVFAMSRSGARGWPIWTGYAAVVFWVIGLIVSSAAVGAGPGGIVYGILIVLPAMAIAMVLQLFALIGFLSRARARA